MPVPLAVLDLVPLVSGSSAPESVANSLDLVRRAEDAGYRRYWYAEHHLNPGVLGSSPALMIALAGAVSTRLRLGSGAVLAGHRSALSIAEEFALLQAALGPRVDLGLGRSGGRLPPAGSATKPVAKPGRMTEEGLLLPAPVSLTGLLSSPRFRAAQGLLHLKGAEPADYEDVVDTLQATFADALKVGGLPLAGAVAAVQASPEIWILGSSRGQSSRLAGERGLRFGANYHVAPSGVVEAIADYRASFRAGGDLPAPHVMVSADVVVAPSDEEAHHLALGFDHWVHSIRSGQGAVPYPSPEEALGHPLDEQATQLVTDRVQTRFVGTPDHVVERLKVLQRSTGADELLVTTITHDHATRVRSHVLLAEAWVAA